MEGIIILDVVVVRLIKHAVRVVVAIWIFVANSSDLTQLGVAIHVLTAWLAS